MRRTVLGRHSVAVGQRAQAEFPGHDLEVDAHEHLRPVTPVVGQVRAGQRQAAHIDKRVRAALFGRALVARYGGADRIDRGLDDRRAFRREAASF
jgi:hypothetical protein